MIEVDEKNDAKTKRIKCDIDGIVASKIKVLKGYGIQRAITTLDEIYELKEAKVSGIEIFDKMAELCWMLREYTSKIKGTQQKLLG